MIVELAQGLARARLASHLGARVTSLRLAAAGRAAVELLLPFPEATTELLHWPKGGIYPLVPYSGRIRDGRLCHAGASFALRPHPDAAPHTLHGHAHRRPWRVLSSAAGTACMVHEHPGDDEWPWPFLAEMVVALPEPSRCKIMLRLVNTGASAAPAGLGLHPYLATPPEACLRLAAAREWPLDSASLPIGEPTAGPDWNGPLEGPVTRQLSDWRGQAWLEMAGANLALSASPALAHLVLHRPAGVHWLCLEPASHVVDGFNLAARGMPGTGTACLAAGEEMSASMALQLLS